MNLTVIYSLASVLVVSLVSLVGVFTLVVSPRLLKRAVFILVSLSVGVLFGDVFVHMLPDVYRNSDPLLVSLFIACGLLLFFILEKFFRWGHVHDDGERMKAQVHDNHVLGSLILLSDGMHNFIDGMIITASFIVSTDIGIATTIAVILHEIPQEVGDFAILIHSGYDKGKALLYNFFSALASFGGVAVVLLIGSVSDASMYAIVSFAAGGFIYIAGSDLVPELQKASGARKSAVQLVSICAGFAIMFGLLYLE